MTNFLSTSSLTGKQIRRTSLAEVIEAALREG
jgi:hypothetical protein